MNFNNRVAIVTGGAGEIGEALGRTFLQNGAKVCLCDVNIKQGKKLLQELQKEFGVKNIIFSKCDVTKDEDFEGVFNACEEQLGIADILINNAGINTRNAVQTMAVNYTGTVKGTELAFKRLGKHNGGKGGFVVNMGSVSGVNSYPYLPFYATSKAAVIHYSRCMGHQLHYNYSGISVLCLCPSLVDTAFTSKEGVLNGSLNAYTDAVINLMMPKLTPAIKLKPMEVAEFVLQLIREYKTGSVLVIKKGLDPIYVDTPLPNEFEVGKESLLKL